MRKNYSGTQSSVKKFPSLLQRKLPASSITMVLLCSLGLALSGCTPAMTHSTPAAATLQDKVDCLVNPEWRVNYGPTTDPRAKLMGSVPEGFVPVEAVLCTGFLGKTITEEYLSGDYTALLAALAVPTDSAPPGSNLTCAANFEYIPGLWLVNAGGKAIHVTWPVNECGSTTNKPDTAKALNALTVSSTKTLDLPVTP